MTPSQALVAEELFQITGRGLVVVPPLPAPASRIRPGLRGVVTVERPDGVKMQMEALASVEHFVLTGGGGKWAGIITFPGRTKDDVPVGSRIWVDAEMLAALGAAT